MDLDDMADVLREALDRVQALGVTLGLDLVNLAGTLARELKSMGIDLVRAAATGEPQ